MNDLSEQLGNLGVQLLELTHTEALIALNTLRSNIIATQRAGWSDTIYPLVAILNAAGFEQFDPSDEQKRHHRETYGGAGGYPGNELSRAAGSQEFS